MINKESIQSKMSNNSKGLFDVELTQDIILNGYSIKKYNNVNYIGLYNPEGKVMTVDAPDYIIEYAPELLDVEFNSILIGGLGIGVIPYVVQDFAEVDVIENDENIIDIVTQLNHLNENVNIIKGDIFTFDVEKTYDVIVLDIWYDALTEELSDQLIEKYLPFVNEGGFLYIPINARVLDNKVKMIKSSSNQ
jgi:protein-L-isoaspartate O-methyltransferase